MIQRHIMEASSIAFWNLLFWDFVFLTRPSWQCLEREEKAPTSWTSANWICELQKTQGCYWKWHPCIAFSALSCYVERYIPGTRRRRIIMRPIADRCLEQCEATQCKISTIQLVLKMNYKRCVSLRLFYSFWIVLKVKHTLLYILSDIQNLLWN